MAERWCDRCAFPFPEGTAPQRRFCRPCVEIKAREYSRSYNLEPSAPDALICPVCSERMNVIPTTHIRSHGYADAESFKAAFSLEFLMAPSVRAKKSSAITGMCLGKRSPEWRAAASRRMAERYREHPDWHFKTYKQGWILSEKADQEVYVRSSWEERVIKVLDQLPEVLEVEVEPFVIPYTFEGQTYHYVPDLLITLEGGVQELWEIKPSRQLDDPRVLSKINALRAYANLHKMNSAVVTLEIIKRMEKSLVAG